MLYENVEENWISLRKKEYPFDFRIKWFRTRNQATWSTYLPLKFGGTRGVNMVQIGVFEGMDLVWCFQNILTHPQSKAIAIDPWKAMGSRWPQSEMDEVMKRAIHNLSPWKEKLEIRRGTSDEILPELESDHFDLVVIDGCHQDEFVIRDAEQALRVLKSGGWMIFDDVRNRRRKVNHVQEGIDVFLKNHGTEVDLAWKHRYCDCYEKK